MADVMRATTPINNRNIIQQSKEFRDTSALPFDFQDPSKVKQATTQSEMLGQNNVIRENGSATVLYTLLKDPDVAASFLKNIFLLREIVGLMPLNNDTQTEEMQQLMNKLLLSPEEIAQEMKNQENISTIFKGDLFDTLRHLLMGNGKSMTENIAENFGRFQIPNPEQMTELPDAVNEIVKNAQAPRQETQENVQTVNQQTQQAPAQEDATQSVTNQTQMQQPEQTAQEQAQIQTQTQPQEQIQPQTQEMPSEQSVTTAQPEQAQQAVPTAENTPPNDALQQQEAVQQTAEGAAQTNAEVADAEVNAEGMVEGEAVLHEQEPSERAAVQLFFNLTADNENVLPETLRGIQAQQQPTQETPQTEAQSEQNLQTVRNEQPSQTEENLQTLKTAQPVQKSEQSAEQQISQILSMSEELSQLQKNPQEASQQEIQDSVINLLKSLYSMDNRTDVLDAVKNNLNYIKGGFPENNEFSKQLSELASKLEGIMNGEIDRSQFSDVKSEVLRLLDSLQTSVLYDGEMAKTVSLAKYNLSRYNDNDNLVSEAFARLLANIPDKGLREKLTSQIARYLETAQTRGTESSKTMSALAEILEKQTENTEAKMLNSESIDRIVHGLLSSPSNFTPLLHYVIPVDNGDVQAMAEIWINPNGEEDVEGGVNSGKKITHMLFVFEISEIGKFETELFVEDKNINLSVFCPPEHISSFRSVNADIRKACESTGYRFKTIDISELKEPRSLMDVFRSLPARRSGINVTI